jgi:26S proteasome regulatory subunit T2
MGQDFSSPQGGTGNNSNNEDGKEKKKKWEPPAPPPRVGKKQRRRNAGAGVGGKLPAVTPNAKCKLRLLKLERLKDYLLMEEEFVANQVRALIVDWPVSLHVV